jgi:hypothetical protein
VQSVPIPAKVVSSNNVHGKVYSIQYYVIKFVSDLRQVCDFFPGTPVTSTNKTEILLKVALKTINLKLNLNLFIYLLINYLLDSKILMLIYMAQ